MYVEVGREASNRKLKELPGIVKGINKPSKMHPQTNLQKIASFIKLIKSPSCKCAHNSATKNSILAHE